MLQTGWNLQLQWHRHVFRPGHPSALGQTVSVLSWLAAAATTATLLATAQAGGRAAAGESWQKGKIIVADAISVTYVTEKEEIMYVLYQNIACPSGYLICNLPDCHDLNHKGLRVEPTQNETVI